MQEHVPGMVQCSTDDLDKVSLCYYVFGTLNDYDTSLSCMLKHWINVQ